MNAPARPIRLGRTYERLLTVNDRECWVWTGHTDADGYGRYGSQLVHRMVYVDAVGPIPAGMTLDHLCHNADRTCAGGAACEHRRCANPEHLEPADHQTNCARGFGARTHCKADHEFTPENTREYRGKRICRRCDVARQAAAKERRRSEQS